MIAKNGKSVRTRFEISQSYKFLKKHSNQELIQKIADFCDVELDPKHNRAYRVRASARPTRNKLIQYFDKYPLLTAKYLDYQDWVLASKIMGAELHYKKRDEIIKLQSGMNKKRTYFNWDHLISYQI